MLYRWRCKVFGVWYRAGADSTNTKRIGYVDSGAHPGAESRDRAVHLHVADGPDPCEVAREDTELVSIGQIMNAVGVSNARSFVPCQKCKSVPLCRIHQ